MLIKLPSHASVAFLGGKGANMNALTIGSILTPETYILPASVFLDRVNESPDAFIAIRELAENKVSDPSVLSCVCVKAENAIRALAGGLLLLPYNELRSLDRGNGFAVRSSAVAEDGLDYSFAGIFDSCLNVPIHSLSDAITTVWASAVSRRVVQYYNRVLRSTYSLPNMSVLIQPMIVGEQSGVIFSQSLSDRNSIMVELSSKGGQSVVDGVGLPETFYRPRAPDEELKEDCSINLKPLCSLGMEIERLLGCPQDIEFVMTGSSITILQSRPLKLAKSG